MVCPPVIGIMRNPWLDVPLAEYEGHMALPRVAQAQLLAGVFERILKEHRPSSVAVLGCAGGNGFERIPTATTRRVVAVDLNPIYIEALRARFQRRIPGLELIVGDIQRGVKCSPVELVYAALVLEYVDVKTVLERIRSLLTEGGRLATVVQLPSATSFPVTPSPFSSIQALAPFMRLVQPDGLKNLAETAGYQEITRWLEESLGGKQFQVQAFRLPMRNRPFHAEGPQPGVTPG